MKKNIVIVGIGKTAQHVYEFIKDYNLYIKISLEDKL